MLLGEHLELIVDAQRATFAGAQEFQAAAAQVNANTTALIKAMGGIVGPTKAAEFQTAWANHVEGLMAYTAAVAGNDQTGKTVAKQNLDGFAERLGPVLQRRGPQPAGRRPADRRHHRPRRPSDPPCRRLRGQGLHQGPAAGAGGLPSRCWAWPTRWSVRDPADGEAPLPVGGSKTGGGGLACRRR